MNVDPPIVILGFGRSGTTWVADIISKCLGGLILFEPFHPCVYSSSKDIYYSSSWNNEEINDHWINCKNTLIRNRWLLRNHLNSPLENSSDHFVNLVWDNSAVIGMKSIRMNYGLQSACALFGTQPVFIIRHPLAVISSILNRPQFWEEFGWVSHWSLFYKELSIQNLPLEIKALINEELQYEEKIALMWSFSNLSALKDLQKLGLEPFYYEDVYLKPYESAKSLLRFVNKPNISIHPSYLFTPSMMTLRTVHDLNSTTQTGLQNFPSFFWRDHLDENQIDNINNVVTIMCRHYSILQAVCRKRGYLTMDKQ